MHAFFSVAMLAAATIAAPASAAIVNLDFTGALSGNLFPEGSILEFHGSYDDSAQPAFDSDQIAFYDTPVFDFKVDGQNYESYSYQYGNVQDDGSLESFTIPFRFRNSNLGVRYTTFNLTFSATGRDLIHDLQLPDAASLAQFNGVIRLSAADDNSRVSTATYVQGVPAVPEPATWALMIGGMGLIGGTMRRRKASVIVSNA